MMYYVRNEDGSFHATDDTNEAFGPKRNFRVRQTRIGPATISTVFLPIDHNFGGEGEPVLWETMIFQGRHHDYMRRYASEEAAILGHNSLVRLLRLEFWGWVVAILVGLTVLALGVTDLIVHLTS